MELQDRIELLYTNADRIDYRMKYSEKLHRKVGDDGDIHHYETMVPFIIVSSALGACVALIARRFIHGSL